MRASQRYGFMAVVTLLILGIGLCVAVKVCAGREQKCAEPAQSSGSWIYHSVKVAEGDTLWELAEDYARPDLGMTRRSFVEKVKQANGISGSEIYAGGTLLVPVYVEEWQ